MKLRAILHIFNFFLEFLVSFCHARICAIIRSWSECNSTHFPLLLCVHMELSLCLNVFIMLPNVNKKSWNEFMIIPKVFAKIEHEFYSNSLHFGFLHWFSSPAIFLILTTSYPNFPILIIKNHWVCNKPEVSENNSTYFGYLHWIFRQFLSLQTFPGSKHESKPYFTNYWLTHCIFR